MNFVFIILGILALLVILLSIPLEFELIGQMQPGNKLRLRLTYLFGLISWNLSRGSRKEAQPEARSTRPDKEGLSIAQVGDLLQTEGLIESLGSLVIELFRKIRTDRIEADLRISLGDDYYTGMLFGCLIPIILYMETLPRSEVKLQPAFEEYILLEGSLFGNWRLSPIEVLNPCLSFAFSKPAWRAARKLISYRCSKKV